uniref:Leucine rich repeats and calponin homology domain containing 4 n=1 Tax=Anolis carolinensis TaxID=28377 RepID=A0A803TVN5_ANOCA
MFYADFILETALSPFWERGRYTNKLLLTYLLTKERKGLRSAAQWKSIHVVSPNTQVWMLFHFHPSPVREDGGELLLPRPLLSPSFLGSVPFLLLLLPCSRNQLSSLPSCVCRLPLKVLIASNNKLASLPEDIGALRSLRQLDVSSNELQSLPSSVGGLESLRDLNLRKNQISCLPEELAELPLVRLDFSCNRVTRIPVCFRHLRHLQSILLENNPLQCPPAQICLKGKIHIFKYLHIEACSKGRPDLAEFARGSRPTAFGTW